MGDGEGVSGWLGGGDCWHSCWRRAGNSLERKPSEDCLLYLRHRDRELHAALVLSGSEVSTLRNYDPRSFDHLAEEYDFAASLERRPDIFLSHLPQRRHRVLDVGCGTGVL